MESGKEMNNLEIFCPHYQVIYADNNHSSWDSTEERSLSIWWFTLRIMIIIRNGDWLISGGDDRLSYFSLTLVDSGHSERENTFGYLIIMTPRRHSIGCGKAIGEWAMLEDPMRAPRENFRNGLRRCHDKFHDNDTAFTLDRWWRSYFTGPCRPLQIHFPKNSTITVYRLLRLRGQDFRTTKWQWRTDNYNREFHSLHTWNIPTTSVTISLLFILETDKPIAAQNTFDKHRKSFVSLGNQNNWTFYVLYKNAKPCKDVNQ